MIKLIFIATFLIIFNTNLFADQGISDEKILVGMHTDLSGPISMVGNQSADGAKMRFEEFNQNGGAYGRTIKFIVEDHQYTVPRAVQAANKLLRKDKVAILLGSLGTPQNNAVLTDQLSLNVPNLFPLTAARSMFEPFHRLKITTGSTYYDQIRTAIDYFFQEKGKRRFCLLYEDTDFGQEIVDGTNDQLDSLGLELIEYASAKPTDTDFTSQINKLKKANCEVIAMGTNVRTSILPYMKARSLNWNAVDFVATSATYFGVLAEQPNGVMDGFYCLNSVVFPYYDSASNEQKIWWDKYKNLYGRDPNTGSLYGYIFADILIKAIKDSGQNLSIDNLVNSFEAFEDFEFPLNAGSATFGKDIRQGNNISYLFQVRDQRFDVIAGPIAY
jgi:branched-chain amino acid transport system substrate-binding protein